MANKKISIEEFWSLMNTQVIKEEAEKQNVGMDVGYTENGLPVPTVNSRAPISFNPPRTMDNPQSIVTALNQVMSEDIYFEPRDKVLEPNATAETGAEKYEQLPEEYSKTIYPATVKPNIDAIIKWVITEKMDNMEDIELMLEAYEVDDINDIESFDDYEQKLDRMADRAAYKVARKIWYVGRKPANMTDKQWNDLTRHMRPAEGTFGGGDKWDNFKYDFDYEYTSGG